jgi:hypothetical protein
VDRGEHPPGFVQLRAATTLAGLGARQLPSAGELGANLAQLGEQDLLGGRSPSRLGSDLGGVQV